MSYGKKIRRVRIVPGCISCGSCEAICPNVFEVTDIAHVRPNGDLEDNAELVREAADMCPVSVIKVDEEQWYHKKLSWKYDYYFMRLFWYAQ